MLVSRICRRTTKVKLVADHNVDGHSRLQFYHCMTIRSFLQLTEEEQLTLLTEEGIYIGKRTDRPFLSVLYQLESFYVEILYREYRRLIWIMNCSESTAILDPYLDQVRVGIPVN